MSEQRKKLVVIDGKSVFYRGYYAMPGLSTSEGTPTGGVYGFAVMALEVIKRLSPDYVCVAWDKPKTNIRKRLEIYPDYKAGRKPAPPDFYVQIPILHELLRAFNWPLYEVDDYEADDIMATLARRANEAGVETVLISSDLDMLQCLSPLTSYYVLKSGLSNIEHYYPEEFEKKYGLKVEQFVDLKALKGDSSDNIPGVPGIGEKGAIQLLQSYGTLDGVYENLWQIKGAMARKLEEGKDLAYLSKRLVVLQDDAPIPLDLKHMDMANLDTRAVEDILKKLEFRTLVRQLPDVMKTDAKKSHSTGEALQAPELSASITPTNVLEVSLHARYSDKLKKDLESILISEHNKAVIIPAKEISSKANLVKELLNGKTVYCYDIKALIKCLWQYNIELDISRCVDVQLLAFLHNSLNRDQSLAGLAREYLDIEIEAEDIDETKRYMYEAAIVSKLGAYFVKWLSEEGNESLKSLYLDIELPVVPVLARMEDYGIEMDRSYFSKMSERLEGEISDLEQTIYGYADDEFNISSPQQLATVLFEKLGLPPMGKKGKNGSFSTAVDILEKLKDSHPIISCIMTFRELTKLKSTYVDPLPLLADENSRLHTTFYMTVAPTGRLSSADPNLQNIPVRTDMGRLIRDGFVASKGKVFVSADYSQFELRLAAVLAHDVDMIDAFNSDTDIHMLTASQVFGVALEDVTKEMRYQAKAVNFGILYGQTPHGLAAGTGMTFAEAKEFIDRYFAQRRPLLDYIESTRQKALAEGYVETLYGRRRPTPDVKSSNFIVREGAFRQAVNMPVQGTEADLMKKAMIILEKRFDEFSGKERPIQVLQIHDSILVECAEGDEDRVGELMRTVMEGIAPELSIKLKVDVHSGRTWGEL